MEILSILLIFALGVILLSACFIGGIAFVLTQGKKLVKKIFGKGD